MTPPRECPNCGSDDTWYSDIDTPPYSTAISCGNCEYDSVLDEDGDARDIVKRDLLASLPSYAHPDLPQLR